MTHGSLFSGIGGFELGAERAGIKTIWNCEINPFCRKVLKKHFPETHQYTDITKLKNPPYVDIISGGFPCQDISVANSKGKGLEGERSGLWREMFRIISEVRPRFVLIENSSNLLRKGMREVLCDLAEIGYDAEWQCLRACDFGLPHKRERIFIIAYTNSIGRVCNIIKSSFIQESIYQGGASSLSRSLPIKRFDAQSDYSSVRNYDEFSKELDKDRIMACGNAVVPAITHFLFECIKNY
ncbi:MAG: DNA (cytosine-5-)-methyltransferase [Treponema sp.]|nr:MAG: DNA (cytosine-5-)-methyltransferase [Treponema sp.]